VAGALVVVTAVLTACSPTYNWREVRLGPLTTLLPCKPDQAKRVVRLGTQELPLEMQGCEAGATLFAVSRVALDDPAQAHTVLADWRAATVATIRSTDTTEVPVLAKGLSAQGASVQAQASGRRPDGQSVQARWLWFTRGTYIYHLAVYGQSIDAQEAATFLAEPRFP